MHDGGADGFQDDRLHAGETTGTFYQCSIQKDYVTKIKRTVKRLRAVGRNPKTLVFVTSNNIPQVDQAETTLSDELNTVIRIRDRAFLTVHINDSIATRAAFDTYLRPLLSYLRSIGSPELIPPSAFVSSPTVYVFLRQELDRADRKVGLINALADGLILWALEGTDPEHNKFMTRREIVDKITGAVPATAKILKGAIPNRLEALAKGKNRATRPIRWYRKQNYYCLAAEFRSRLEEDNASDESLRLQVLAIFERRILTDTVKLTPELAAEAANLSLRVVQKTFEKEGLEFAAFLGGTLKASLLPTVGDYIEACLEEGGFRSTERVNLKIAITNNLQSAFYSSQEAERLLFSRLAATFTLLFCLNSDSRVIEYFQQMASDFYLYVGTDLLVRALSERYLRSEDQATRNALRLIREAGGTLALPETVLEEVYSHIASTDYEFVNKYERLRPDASTEFIFRNSDRILIRAYFYARYRTPEGVLGPKNWNDYIEQFCEVRDLHKPAGKEQIKNYLIAEFGLRFESKEDLEKLTKEARVTELSKRLMEYKKSSNVAKSDALLTLGVYGRRKERREHSHASAYGYRTWWLTAESRILAYTTQLVHREGAQFIMRPDFIVRFLAIAPSAADIRHSFESIFPSLLGIRLARRVDPSELAKILEKVAEAETLEPGRRAARISTLADKLKTQFYAIPLSDGAVDA